jgi:hypothetical protein
MNCRTSSMERGCVETLDGEGYTAVFIDEESEETDGPASTGWRVELMGEQQNELYKIEAVSQNTAH